MKAIVEFISENYEILDERNTSHGGPITTSRSHNTGVMWSNFRVLVIERAAAFGMDCNLLSTPSPTSVRRLLQ